MVSDRFLVAIGYHGNSFHGSQIQPEVRTVEGSIRQALRRLNWWSDGCLEISSRTDSGVSARVNLARIDLPKAVSEKVSHESIVNTLNDHLPVGVVAIRARRSPPGSRVRNASFRRYLYLLGAIEEWPSDPDPDLISQVCPLFEGEHDFTNLSRLEEGTNPIRTVDDCSPWFSGDGRPIGFSIRSRSFIWNQVRRIASSISGIASGRIGIPDLKAAIEEPHERVDLGRAPASGLVLWSISHPDFEMPMPDKPPPGQNFTGRPPEPRDYRRWMAMAGYEMSSLLEREWLSRIE